MSVASSKQNLVLREATQKYTNQEKLKPSQIINQNLNVKPITTKSNITTVQFQTKPHQNLSSSDIEDQSVNSQSNINNQQQTDFGSLSNQNSFALNKGSSSRHTSGPNTCIKMNQNKHSQYRYSGSPNQNEYEEEEEQQQEDDDSQHLQYNEYSQNLIEKSKMEIEDLESSQENNADYSGQFNICKYRNDEILQNVTEENSQITEQSDGKNDFNYQKEFKNFIKSKKSSQKQLQTQTQQTKTVNINRFQYVVAPGIEMIETQNSRQHFGGAKSDPEEAFLFDSLNSQAHQPPLQNQHSLPQQSKLNSQMQLTLKQAVASFAQEKQMSSMVHEVQKENLILKEENASLLQQLEEKDDEVKELRIQLKDMEIRLCHAEGMIKRERQEKENNAIAFKRILSNITAAQNKENSNPTIHSSINTLPNSSKKYNQRKLSQQIESNQASISSQPQNFKFMMCDLSQGGTLGATCSKTLENENTITEYNTLDQIQKLKHQLTFKEEELKNLRKQHRRAGNQSVWWFNNRGQPSKNHFNNSGSAGYSPLPTQPSMPSYYQNPLIENQKSIKKIKPYQQQYQMLSPMQGSPLLSNHGSINSWVNQQINPNMKVAQFQPLKDEFRPSQTEAIANENSFDQDTSTDNSTKEAHPNQKDLKNPHIIRGNNHLFCPVDKQELNYGLEEEEEQDDEGDQSEQMGIECQKQEKKLEMMISGGDYSPNSHTFFKHPFKNNQSSQPGQTPVMASQENIDSMNNSKLIVLNKCPKHEKQVSQSAHTQQRRQDIHQEQQKSQSFYGSILSNKSKQVNKLMVESPLTMFSKGAQSKQVSRKQSPLNMKITEQNHHSTLDNSDLIQAQTIPGYNGYNQQNENDAGNRVSLGLGPHNTLGTTIATSTQGMNTSNISPFKQGKRLIPDSLVKMPKFSTNNQKKLNISNYQTINRC